MNVPEIALGEFMLSRNSSTDPARFPDELFTLYSIPAFDVGRPERQYGRDIGSAKKNIEPGDILLSRLVPHIRRSWIVGHHDKTRIVGSGEWIIFRSSKIDAAYLRHFLVSDPFHIQFMQTVAGVGGSLLRANPRQVADIAIPLPPLDEQRRIAAILDKADALRRERKRALKLFGGLTQSIFLDMFGDPLRDGPRWNRIVPLSQLTNIGSGITKGRKLNGSATRNVPYLAVANVQDKALDLSAIKTIDATDSEIARYRLEADDLLLTEGGDPDKLGRGTLWSGEIPEIIHQNHVFRVRVVSGEILPLYLNWLVGSSYGKAYFLRLAKQTTGIASINKTQLSDFPVIMPPLHTQRRFVERAEAVRMAAAKQSSMSKQVEALFSSLQHRAFTGQL